MSGEKSKLIELTPQIKPGVKFHTILLKKVICPYLPTCIHWVKIVLQYTKKDSPSNLIYNHFCVCFIYLF